MGHDGKPDLPRALTLLHRLFPPEIADDIVVSLWDLFDKWRAAGYTTQMAGLRCACEVLEAVLRVNSHYLFEGAKSKLSYANGAALVHALLIGKGNGSLMTRSERLSFYAGQAAIGAMLGLASFLFLTALDPRSALPNALTGYPKLAFAMPAIFAFIAVIRTAWKRDEFPILGFLFGSGLGSLAGFLIAALGLSMFQCVFDAMPGAGSIRVFVIGAALIGAIVALRVKHGAREAASADASAAARD